MVNKAAEEEILDFDPFSGNVASKCRMTLQAFTPPMISIETFVIPKAGGGAQETINAAYPSAACAAPSLYTDLCGVRLSSLREKTLTSTGCGPIH